jgi:hypothetical protein
MQLPGVSFTEDQVGVVPITSGVRNRIAVVGEFDRGPANQFSFLGGFSDFSTRYGSNTSTGSQAVQAIYQQGAPHVSAIRVLGRSRQATASIAASGILTEALNSFFTLQVSKVEDLKEEATSGLYPLFTLSASSFYSVSNSAGHYLFKVTAAGGADATSFEDPDFDYTLPLESLTVKYVFVANGTSPTIDWASVTTTLEFVDTTTPVVLTDSGLTFTLGTTSRLRLDSDGDPILDLSLDVENVQYQSPVTGAPYPASYVLDLLAQEINTKKKTLNGVVVENRLNDPIGSAEVVDGEVLKLTIKNTITPTESNRFKLRLTNIPSGISTTPIVNTSVNFSGGIEGPKTAYRDYYSADNVPVLRIQALSNGTWGNALKVSVLPASGSRLKILVEDPVGLSFEPPISTETFVVDFSDTDQNGNLLDLQESRLIRGIFIPRDTVLASAAGLDPNAYAAQLGKVPVRLAPKDPSITAPLDPDNIDYSHPDAVGFNYLQAQLLENGDNGPTITEDDYVAALEGLNGQPVHIVLCPGQYSDKVRQAIVSHCSQTSEQDGLRIGVINASPNLSPDSSVNEIIGYTSDRVVMVAGWSTFVGQNQSRRFGLSPDALYAGKLAAIPYFVSPASRRTAGSVVGISEVDTARYSNRSQLQVYADNSIETLALDPSLRGFFFMTGQTTSPDTAWTKISIRRTYDVIRMDLFDSLQQYKSEPYTTTLRGQIASSINNYLFNKRRNGEIQQYLPTSVDSSNNNTEDFLNGVLNITVRFLPVYSADYLVVALVRQTNGLVIS